MIAACLLLPAATTAVVAEPIPPPIDWSEPEPRTRMRRWVDRGLQSPEGERTLGRDLPGLAD